MSHETQSKTRHRLAENARPSMRHETMAASDFRSLVGGVERMSLGIRKGSERGEGYTESQTRTPPPVENQCNPVASSQKYRVNEEASAESRRSKEAAASTMPWDRILEEPPRLPSASPKMQVSINTPDQSTIKNAEQSTKPFTNAGSDSDDFDEKLEKQKLSFVYLKRRESDKIGDWVAMEKYASAALDIRKNLRSHSAETGDLQNELIEQRMLYYVCKARFKQGRYSDALEMVESAVNANKPLHPAYQARYEYLAAMIYYHRGDFGPAKRRCKRAIKLAREDPDPQGLRTALEGMITIIEKDVVESDDAGVELEFYRSLLSLQDGNGQNAQKQVPTPMRFGARPVQPQFQGSPGTIHTGILTRKA